jgi:glycosyltransferase involved in cell wall biosynthesis
MRDTVIICVPTFRRPKMLKRLLDAIAALETGAEISVLVADNDPEGRAGLDLCLALEGYRWPLTAVIALNRGIAQARNTLVEYALIGGASFIAMIDDDEWPEVDWIDQLLKTAHQTNADVVQGSVLFGPGGDGAGDIRRPTGPVTMLQGAGNLLIRRRVLEEMPAPWFDPHQDFFLRLGHAGKRFAWCDEARAHGAAVVHGE